MSTQACHTPPRIGLTAGEPAGIGPDIVLMLAQQDWPVQLVAICNIDVLNARADALGLQTTFIPHSVTDPVTPHKGGTLPFISVPLGTPVTPGQLSTANAQYVLATLDYALELCIDEHFQAIVTAPVQKSVINDAGIPFSGHTEFFAERTQQEQVVMLLTSPTLKVALATTHIPLRQVPDAITSPGLSRTLHILRDDLRQKFGLANPHITVLGLNPHAGEGGHLGREELDIIIPTLAALRQQGFNLDGPLPADTAFNPLQIAKTDAFLAMYHDQGLTVLKYSGFGHSVNITLGLPIIRTSVDHGTALDLAGTGKAQCDSLIAALQLAIACCEQQYY